MEKQNSADAGYSHYIWSQNKPVSAKLLVQ